MLTSLVVRGDTGPRARGIGLARSLGAARAAREVEAVGAHPLRLGHAGRASLSVMPNNVTLRPELSTNV